MHASTSLKQHLLSLLAGQQAEAARQVLADGNLDSIRTAEDLSLLAYQFRKLNDRASASRLSLRATNAKPQDPELALLAAADLVRTGQTEIAETLIQKLPEPLKRNAGVLMLASAIHYQRHQFDQCLEVTAEILRQHPNYAAAHLERAHALLMLGRWQEGWQEYQWRFRLKAARQSMPRFRMPLWQGQADTPHLLLVADQGYGDCFQFSRYLPLAAQRCQKITLMRSEPLARLFDASPHIDQSFSSWDDTPLTSAYCALSDLPAIFGTTPETIPPCEGILHAQPQDIRTWQTRLASNEGGLRIGLAWSGRVEFEDNFLRAPQLEALTPLLSLPGVTAYSLQVGAPARQAREHPLIDLSKDLDDFSTTAAVMECLDLVVTADTSVAHLAGTLGRPTCVLLAQAPDWRWGSSGSHCPWYPGMRLARQPASNDWHTPVEEIVTLLQSALAADAPREAVQRLCAAPG